MFDSVENKQNKVKLEIYCTIQTWIKRWRNLSVIVVGNYNFWQNGKFATKQTTFLWNQKVGVIL